MASDRPIRILHLEDDADYCSLVRDLLDFERIPAELVGVTNRVSFEDALARGNYDLILGDFSLPDYTGLQALAAVRERAPQTPFVLVTGTLGEQEAVESLRAGATDYVLKQWPDRLVPAIQRAVAEARERERRRQAESALIRKEYFYRTLTDNLLDVVSLLDGRARILYSNASSAKVLGYSPTELIGRSLFDHVHPADRVYNETAFSKGRDCRDSPTTLEFRFRHGNGNWVHLEAVGHNRLDDPEIGAFVFNIRDATERRRLEMRQQALYQLGHDIGCARDAHAAAVMIRDVADKLFAWDALTVELQDEERQETQSILNMDTIDGKRVEVGSPEQKHAMSALARRVIQNGPELILREAPVRLPPEARAFGDKDRPSASLLVCPIRHGCKVIGSLSVQSYSLRAYTQRDLESLQVLADYCGGALERIASEQALRDSEQRFREIFANSPDAIFLEDEQGGVLDVNPAGCRLLASNRSDLLGRRLAEFIREDRSKHLAKNRKRFSNDFASRVEGECLAADGRVTPVESRATPIDYNGRSALLLHVRDIRERKETQHALRSSEMLFHSVWENSVDGMRLTDEHGMIVAVNEAFCKLVGMSRAELEGNPFTVVYANLEEPEEILRLYQQRFRDRVIERQIDRRLTLRNGQVVVFEDTSSFLELRGQSPLLLCLFRDVTNQKRLEDQLRQSQKMDAIGQLAGGVAHDFNNILTVINGHAALLAGSVPADSLASRSAQQIVQASDRAAALTRQLLTFSRRQVMQLRQLDLNEVVTNMTRMLVRILGEDIVLQFTRWKGPALVQADAGMLEQVLLNLAVNSRDAMPRGGSLNIQVRVEEVDAAHVAQFSQARTGNYVCLETNDTGCGIPPEIVRRIFEPFFTTKEMGKGTGLGLATVYGIVQQHQGWIEVESEIGRGATFRVFLPVCNGTKEGRQEGGTEFLVRGGGETILVVEDEQPVRELVSRLLQEHGYKILTAESGARALEVWRQHKEEIVLLLTDVVMPDHISGRELAEKLWAEQPKLRVVFTSGYSADVVGKNLSLRRGFRYVQKPYQPRKLARAVRECLDAAELIPAI